MNVPAVVVPAAPRSHFAVLRYFCDDIARRRPALGHLFAALRSDINRLSELIAEPTWCDYLDVHKLSEFTESPASISRSVKFEDEPLFALEYAEREEMSTTAKRLRRASCAALIRRAWDYILAPTVEHKTFGFAAALHRKQLSDGAWSLVVKQGKNRRTLLLDADYWITPVKKLMGVKVQPAQRFKHDDGSPETMDKGYHAFLYSGGPACLSRGVEFPLREVHPQFSIAFTQQRRALTIAWEIKRREHEESPNVRSVKFKVVRRKHSAMGKLMSLYAGVTEKMRGDEEADHYANIEELSYKQAFCYLRACSRWLTEKKMSGKQGRTLNDILSESRTFPN